MNESHTHHKTLIAPFRQALYRNDVPAARAALAEIMAPDCLVHMCHPYASFQGIDALFDCCFLPLSAAFPDLERRDFIVMAGATNEGNDWVGCAGRYIGTFVASFLDIPPTGHIAEMRFHEFYRFEAGKIVEVQAIWDIPELMMQAGAWPMAPSLGRALAVFGPATQDGLVQGPWDADAAGASCNLVREMLAHLVKHPAQGGPEVMELGRFWHPHMMWYGPAGIGVARGIEGFRTWHQIPFLNAMPDRGTHDDDLVFHFFGDGPYAAVTGWPNMLQTLSGDGWMGIAPTGKRIQLCSLDFWRIEEGRIRENWVLIDLLDVYRQLGIDVLARMREFNKARVRGAVDFQKGVL